MNVTVCDEKAHLSSIDNIHTIHLAKDRDRLIPEGYDIHDTCIELPSEVDAFRLLFGGQVVATFTKDNLQDLRNFPIYLTKATYHVACIQLVYNKDFLMQHEEYSLVDEMVEEEEYGEYVEIFDGCEYHEGQVVQRVKVPTGNKVREITQKVEVDLPKITFMVRPSEKTQYHYIEVPVRQKVQIHKGEKQRFTKEYHLQVVSESDHYITGYVTNYIMYRQNLAGLRYNFIGC
jgi:hypothetical protein